MRFKYYGALALTSVLALGCASAPSAGAFSWWTGNAAAPHEEKELKTGETATFAETTLKNKYWTQTARETTIGCRETKIEKGALEGPAGGSAHALKVSGCSVKYPAGCAFKNEEESITTGTVTLALLQSGGKTLLEIKPKSGSTLGKFTLANISQCGLLRGKTLTIEGRETVEIESAAECLAEHILAANEAFTEELKWGSLNLEAFTFGTNPSLASGKCWAAH